VCVDTTLCLGDGAQTLGCEVEDKCRVRVFGVFPAQRIFFFFKFKSVY